MEFVEYIKSPSVEKVLLKRSGDQYVEGTLCVTGHHLIFSSRKEHNDELILLHSSVEHMKKKFAGQEGMLTIRCKNFDVLKLRFNCMEEALNVASSVEVLSFIENAQLKYPFFYPHPKCLAQEDGWGLFSIKNEFSKLSAVSPNNWRISNVNSEYQICSSYPAAIIVPSGVSDDVIIASARFRHGGRFPILSYFHQPSGAVLMRSGQPMTTIGGKRSRQDESLVNAVVRKDLKGIIVDTRSATAAMNSRSRGGGMESDSHYPRWKKNNQNIEKYTVLNDSIAKLAEACFDPKINMNSWFSKLESSGWLDHVQSVLTTACYTAQCLDKQGTAVLVHGDEGMDTTLQVTSLAQVLLDSDCRTIKGFEALIDREWLRGGHPFAERCVKVGVSPVRYKGQGPVFLLFLDCVWQIYQQFPCSFEFNEKFLITLFEHAYSSEFGTFLCNNEKQRVAAELHEKTISLWSYLNQKDTLKVMINPMYEANKSVLWPSVASQSLVVWSGLYLKWQKGTRNEEVLWTEVRRIQEINKELKSKATSLRMEYAELQAKVLEERRKWEEEQEIQAKSSV